MIKSRQPAEEYGIPEAATQADTATTIAAVTTAIVS